MDDLLQDHEKLKQSEDAAMLMSFLLRHTFNLIHIEGSVAAECKNFIIQNPFA